MGKSLKGTKTEKNLLKAFLSLKAEADAKDFLRDLLTEKEIDEFAKRLKAAQMLSDKHTYIEVERETGFSSTTVARVARWLNRGEGGYKNILAQLHHPTGKA